MPWYYYCDIRLDFEENNYCEFSVPQIEYTLGGNKKKCSYVYFLLQVVLVILLFCQIVLLFDINIVLMLLQWLPDVTIVQSDVTIVVPWQLSTGSIHDYIFCCCSLVGILFEVWRINTGMDHLFSYVWLHCVFDYSTVSSGVNSLAAVILVDAIQPCYKWYHTTNMKDQTATTISKLLGNYYLQE